LWRIEAKSYGDERGRNEMKMDLFAISRAISRTMRAAWVSEDDDRSVCEAMRETYEKRNSQIPCNEVESLIP
jgi:hypothetical protein